jgi:cardiolipin synthase
MSDSAPFGRGRLRRLVGLDRTGRKPRPTRRGEPLHPWTIPNLVGYARLAALPLFLYLAFDSGDGRSAAAAAVYWLIAAGDYLDGFLARVTGQYSRMGALLDPLVDRMLVISGVAVCWYFELLPRWALGVLVARELFVMGLVRWGLRRGLNVKVNWLGRAGVWPVMSALFFAMADVSWLAHACLYVGLVLVVGATVLYVQEAGRQARAAPSS